MPSSFAWTVPTTLLLLATSTPAQFLFGDSEPIGATGGVQGLYAFHCDDDAFPDVVIVAERSGYPQLRPWLRNVGQGSSFAEAGRIDPRVDATSLALGFSHGAADLDGDGRTDIAYRDYPSGTFTWMRNRADHDDFALGRRLAEPLAGPLIFADLDGDGDEDLLTRRSSDQRVVWFSNVDGLGDLQFAETLDYEPGDAVPVLAADLDGDADLDLVMGSSDLGLHWTENVDGEGGFEGTHGLQQFDTTPTRAEDFDGDGDLDLLTIKYTFPTQMAWLRNVDGAGTFELGGVLLVPTEDPPRVNNAEVLDADGDGDLDIMAATTGGARLFLVRNVGGPATFAPPELVYEEPATGNSLVYMAVADFDVDGAPDVLVSSTKGFTRWWRNTGGGWEPPRSVSERARFPRATTALDIDLDGDLDVLHGESSASQPAFFAWWEQLDTDPITWRKHVTSEATENQSSVSAFPIHLDDDAHADVLAGNGEVQELFRFDPAIGEYVFADTLTTGFGRLFVRDYDLDGLQDVVLIGSGDQLRVRLFPRLPAAASFGPPQELVDEFVPGASFKGLDVVDIDGDGALEVLIGDDAGLDWYEAPVGTTTSAPTPHMIFGAANSSDTHLVGDLDQDGDLDVLRRSNVVSHQPHGLSWARNQGAGAFGDELPLLEGWELIQSPALSDADGDGLTDVLFFGEAPADSVPRLRWLRGLGDGAFAAPEPPAPVDAWGDLVMADVDADGSDDVLVWGASISSLRWYAAGAPTSPFRDLGGATPGLVDPPRLTARGRAQPGAELRLALRGGPASSVTALVLGDVISALSFAGGALVPAPSVVSPGHLTDTTGAADWRFRLPPDLGYEVLVVQAWSADLRSPTGLVASNAVAALIDPLK